MSLAACPFCGAKEAQTCVSDVGVYVECARCNASTRVFDPGAAGTKEQCMEFAQHAWNERA